MRTASPWRPPGGAVLWQSVSLHFMHAKLRRGEATSAGPDPSSPGHLLAMAAPCANSPPRHSHQHAGQEKQVEGGGGLLSCMISSPQAGRMSPSSAASQDIHLFSLCSVLPPSPFPSAPAACCPTFVCLFANKMQYKTAKKLISCCGATQRYVITERIT